QGRRLRLAWSSSLPPGTARRPGRPGGDLHALPVPGPRRPLRDGGGAGRGPPPRPRGHRAAVPARLAGLASLLGQGLTDGLAFGTEREGSSVVGSRRPSGCLPTLVP